MVPSLFFLLLFFSSFQTPSFLKGDGDGPMKKRGSKKGKRRLWLPAFFLEFLDDKQILFLIGVVIDEAVPFGFLQKGHCLAFVIKGVELFNLLKDFLGRSFLFHRASF
jgi:hypothetical protein